MHFKNHRLDSTKIKSYDHFFMNYGYLGFIIKPKGDFMICCYALDGRTGFNFLWSSYFLVYCFLSGGRDLPFIIEYFSLLNTYCWIF
jgi:hypothetical protein